MLHHWVVVTLAYLGVDLTDGQPFVLLQNLSQDRLKVFLFGEQGLQESDYFFLALVRHEDGGGCQSTPGWRQQRP